MFFLMLAAMGDAIAATTPSTNQPTVATLIAGSCNGASVAVPARIRVTWTIADGDGDNYTSKLYENGILVNSRDATSGAKTYDKTITGYITDGFHSQFTSDWTYRVDIERDSDAAVVSTSSSAEWVEQYGTCS